ncbi:hypothetical protein B0T17DRAFT_32329 [Bombardia bombarda]|uniref:Secreted protein n=1 Tax=Bombardia bombarda TaxID=252184 RepID=A0AA40CEB9_9PEZI|nr:hypothetical protein B0T17DRAFT_32329 [Bombardia bombarda]
MSSASVVHLGCLLLLLPVRLLPRPVGSLILACRSATLERKAVKKLIRMDGRGEPADGSRRRLIGRSAGSFIT